MVVSSGSPDSVNMSRCSCQAPSRRVRGSGARLRRARRRPLREASSNTITSTNAATASSNAESRPDLLRDCAASGGSAFGATALPPLLLCVIRAWLGVVDCDGLADAPVSGLRVAFE